MGVSVFTDFEAGIEGCDIVMMLRLQTERMAGTETPSQREYFNLFGLDSGKLMRAAPNALVMHPACQIAVSKLTAAQPMMLKKA